VIKYQTKKAIYLRCKINEFSLFVGCFVSGFVLLLFLWYMYLCLLLFQAGLYQTLTCKPRKCPSISNLVVLPFCGVLHIQAGLFIAKNYRITVYMFLMLPPVKQQVAIRQRQTCVRLFVVGPLRMLFTLYKFYVWYIIYTYMLIGLVSQLYFPLLKCNKDIR